ncbi:GTPase HflX [Fulvivirga kasyanovii]|uniref:GTPase HflX n=1 Tax=Fulvivirga kasyanovii TaxID=396812 RepID=A0ABW9RUJ1_9BACT|nr:GTPase HflX [Fulvivirga kasyanovii]MTI26705.1 GTPase HflX [Fulvivirga kasyanovii]
MDDKNNKGVLVSVAKKGEDDRIVEEHLDELAFLALTANITTEKIFTQKLEQPDKRTFIGKGKLEEVHAYVVANEIDLVIFDDDLSPSQLRNLEKDLKCQIYDRSLLILDIFLNRAQTAQAKTQVELARYQYLMPRLTRMWTHLERQRGGTGTRGGAGEKEIETDRRIIRNQISVLKKKLEKIEKQNAVQRKSRSNIVRVALVGYTNVGKSTLMRILSKSDVKAEDKLFATVDATVRKVVLHNIPFLLSDTVGFIRKLPHHLIESFKSTLAEVREADILLHVVDISHPAYEDHIRVVKETLRDIEASDKPTIYVFNKIDLLENEDEEPVEKMHSIHMEEDDEKVFVSAQKGINIDGLKELILKKVKKRHYQIFPNYLKDEYYLGQEQKEDL